MEQLTQTANAAVSGPRFLWHYQLHQRVASEQLVFSLVSFDPIYVRRKMVESIKLGLSGLGIRSYAVWELVGEHDLLLQTWLPAGVNTDRLAKVVANCAPQINTEVTPMSVQAFHFHHMWDDLIDVNEVQRSVSTQMQVALNGPSSRGVSRQLLRDYEARGIVAKLPNASNSCKFFLRITNPRHGFNNTIQDELLNHIEKAVAATGVQNVSLMRTSGEGGCYLLTGRVRQSNFSALAKLNLMLGESGLLDALRVRTITHISALAEPVDRREQLLADVQVDADQKPTSEQLNAWLMTAEGDELELKASAFTDVDNKVGKKTSALSRDEMVQQIAKAVVGMLNTQGGTIVIGVAELDKYSPSELTLPYKNPPQFGTRAILGIDSEYTDNSGWDKYQRVLASKLRGLIEGNFEGWLKYHLVLTDTDRELCVIRVRRPPIWYYVKSKEKSRESIFYGRVGGETRPFHGSARDAFQQAHPRTIGD